MARPGARGFTLPELLVVLVVLGVLLTLGVPSFTAFIRNQRVKTASFDLLASLTVARSEAIVKNTSVTLTPTSGVWTSGWTITYVDAGGTTVTLRSQDAIPGITINGPTSVVYRGSGRINATSAPQFELTGTGDSIVPRCITVDLSGRPVSKATTC
jgi:type IV fimbrial biogenesis protein FimT